MLLKKHILYLFLILIPNLVFTQDNILAFEKNIFHQQLSQQTIEVIYEGTNGFFMDWY